MNNDLTQTVFGEQLGYKFTLAETLGFLNKNNLLNIGELAELAISIKSNVAQARACQEGYDLVNGIEIKHGQTHHNPKKTRMVAWLSKKNKTGRMLAIVTESVTNKQYYFDIPHSAYSKVRGNAFVISFKLDGTPIKSNRSYYMPNWWNYEVKDFATLCEIAATHQE